MSGTQITSVTLDGPTDIAGFRAAVRALIAAGTREFRITGPWADPQVEPLERVAGQAVPRIGPPPAPAASAAPLPSN